MSWRYTSYTPRDLSSSRDSSQTKFGLYNSKISFSPGDKWSSCVPRDSKFYRSSVEPVEHSPVWAKTNIGDNPASVQRLKERYTTPEEPRKEIRRYKKAETKDVSSSTIGRQYGRTLTNVNLDETVNEALKFRTRLEKSSELDKTRSGVNSLDNRKVLYMPTATTKLLTRKYSSDLSPTTADMIIKDKLANNEVGDNDESTITVVTRGTSPTPTTSSVYLRSKRMDYGLDKKVSKPRKKPETADKETQTEREMSLSTRYSAYNEGGTRLHRSSYGGSSCNSKFASRSNFGFENKPGLSDCRRSIIKEDSDNLTSSDSQQKSLASKPPTSVKTPPMTPVKDSEKKTLNIKSPPTNIRSSLKLDFTKTELARNSNSPTHLCSPLQSNIITTETLSKQTGGQSPKVTIDLCPDINQTIDDVSSLSESSEEETSSDEEVDKSSPIAMTVKKSVTNFLQNIPNHLSQNQSKANLYQKVNTLSPPKINFKKIESGERAWWLESTDKVPDSITGMKSTQSVFNQDYENPETKTVGNYLSPSYLITRQFSRDKDWLKGSCEDMNKINENHSSREEPRMRTNVSSAQNHANGEAFTKPQIVGNCSSTMSAELNHQMKFNRQPGECLTDFQRECSVKDLTQKLQNGIGSPVEDKNIFEAGDMMGMISKVKPGLAKSKTKLDVMKSSSRETSPKITDPKSEIDLYWKELADSLNRPLKLCDLDFTDLNSDDETDILGNDKINGEVPPPPPMLIIPMTLGPAKNLGVPAPPTNINPSPLRTRTPAPPPVQQMVKNKKTVKLFWKEVKDEPAKREKALDGASLIWDELTKVKVDTQKLEYLFESRAKDVMSKKQQDQNKSKEIIVLDPKRSNAINIGMTKLPPPRAIKAAILKMDATVVNKEGIEKLLTMLPTEEEKLRIQEAQNTNPEVPLGSAEQFLLTLASIIELEARLRLWAFKLNFENTEKEICEPLMDLKQGMEILRMNKTFRGILSSLLSIGNFLNGYDVKGFQIDYLSKVPEVKDTVHKHSLLHHLCIIVMEKFPDSTDLYSEIGAVTRASKVDFDELAVNIKKVEEECKLSWNYLKIIAKHEGHTAMKIKMSDFLADCAERIIVLGTVHKRIMNRFRKFTYWLGVPMNRISTTRPNEIFKIISEFALEYRTTRDRVLQQIKKMNREKSRTRGFLSADPNDIAKKKMNSKEAKDDARLKQLLQEETTYSESLINSSTWRRQRRDTKNLLQEVNNNDEEILDALIKTANQVPSQRLKERRRSKIYGKHSRRKKSRKSLGKTPKRSNGKDSKTIEKPCPDITAEFIAKALRPLPFTGAA